MTYSSTPNPRRVQSILLKPNSGYRGPDRIRWGYHVLMQQALELQVEREKAMTRLYGQDEEGFDQTTSDSDMRKRLWSEYDEQERMEEEEEKRRHEEFVRKRKIHYQMGDVLKQYKDKDY
ncbi:hypothetical protein G6F37_007070 [Rhizopus arrhizus]|nr:hypothetical protein G6F38_007136 [Rhizopus arrhizus]KAG1157036.1 hypothetical protein G6F37_007070 [Rhizopus arrhizus]